MKVHIEATKTIKSSFDEHTTILYFNPILHTEFMALQKPLKLCWLKEILVINITLQSFRSAPVKCQKTVICRQKEKFCLHSIKRCQLFFCCNLVTIAGGHYILLTWKSQCQIPSENNGFCYARTLFWCSRSIRKNAFLTACPYIT